MCGTHSIKKMPYCKVYFDNRYDQWVVAKYLYNEHSPVEDNWWDVEDLKCEIRVSNEVIKLMDMGEAKIHSIQTEYDQAGVVYKLIFWLKEGDGAYMPLDEGFAINA